MSFQVNYTSLIINGIQYDKEALLEGLWQTHIPSDLADKTDNVWQESIQQFLNEWINEEPTVTVQTSGSTGNPKKIQLSKEQMMNSAFMTGKYFNFKSGDTALLCLPCDFIAGKMMVVRAMVWGLDLRLVPPSGNPMAPIIDFIDFAAMVPLQVENLIEKHPEKFSLIKKLIIGGGKVTRQLQDKLQPLPTQCYATYGMTETITHVAIKVLNGKKRSDVYQGLSAINFEIDQRGCLIISAPRLSNDLVVTKDLVNLMEGQKFEWLGRFDNVINTGGVKVFPEKIEAKLEKFLPQRFFISSLPDKKLENKVILLIEDQEWMLEKLNALQLDLKQVLSKFELPKNIFFIANFVETPTKKIQRNRTKQKLVKFNL